MATVLAKLTVFPAISNSRLKEPENSEWPLKKPCNLQIQTSKLRSLSELRASNSSDNVVGFGQNVLLSKVPVPIIISSQRERYNRCAYKASDAVDGSELPFMFDANRDPELSLEEARQLGQSVAGEVFENLGDDRYTKVIQMYDDEGNIVGIVTGGSNGDTHMPTLEKYGTNLTKLAEEGKLYLAVASQDQVEHVLQILCRQTENNPCLIGAYSVGRTAIVEGLALRIVSGDVPDTIKGKKVIKLEMSLLLAGAKRRGELELRLKKLIEDIKQSDEIILFIDEMHSLLGAGDAEFEGAIPAAAANILKAAIARGEMKCIVAVKSDEFRKHIVDDPALVPVKVPEPSLDETIEILKGLRAQQGNRHEVRYTNEALFSAKQLFDRYMIGRRVPDNTILSIDRADAGVCIRDPQLLEEAKEEAGELLKKLMTISKSKAAVCVQDVVKLLSRELGFEAELSRELDQLAKLFLELERVDSHRRQRKLWYGIRAIIRNKEGLSLKKNAHIDAIITKWTGIPIDRYRLDLIIPALKMRRFFINLFNFKFF